MNELIQELAYQAEDLADAEVDAGSEFHPAFCRIFAKLIVEECADLVDNHEDSYPYISFGDMIKQHFGVES